MSIIAREDIDSLNTLITVTIEKSDYNPKFEKELAKQSQKAHMKGFRKGKTPSSVLRKMYGKSILADVINELLQTKLFEYLDEHKIQYLGQPMPSDKQEQVDFNLQDLQDFEFAFELGLVPQFDLQGLGKEHTFTMSEVAVADDVIDKEIESARKQNGKQVTVEDGLLEEDKLVLEAVELEGDTPREGGIRSEFSLLVNKIAHAETRELVLGKKQGDTFVANIYELEEGSDEAFVHRYFLHLEEGAEGPQSPMFEFTIKEVTRVELSDLNQEFWDWMFGEGQVQTEEEARAKISAEIASHYVKQAEALLYRDFQDFLMDINKLELPDTFLKKWLISSNENLSETQLEEEYPHFANNLKWTLIKNKISEAFGVRVTRQEIIDNYKERIKAYLGHGGGNFNDDMLNSIAESVMKDQKEVEKISEEVLADKLFDVIKEHVSINTATVSMDEFREIAQKAREEAAKNDEQPAE